IQEKLSKKTIGVLISDLKKETDLFPQLTELIDTADKCLKCRNYLAHRFFYEYAVHFLSEQGRKKMKEKLELLIDLFSDFNQELENFLSLFDDKVGISKKI
ncbi:MAG: hypothetical protein AAGA27_07630, partial [Pseudomonadota bacterium]